MSTRTKQIREWLEMRYQQGLLEGLEYKSYSPVYGLQEVHRTETGDSPAMRYCMMLQVFRALDEIGVRSLLDVGCAEGFIAAKATELFACSSVGVEMGVQACKRATELTCVPVLSASADSLPFADSSFDVVTMTEVIEHLENPFQALAECWRVARKAVIVTTQEFLPTAVERWICMQTVNLNEDHAERNFSHASDWRLLFGQNVMFRPQGCYPKLLSTPFNTQNAEAAAQTILDVTDHPLGAQRYFGMVGIISKSTGLKRKIQERRRAHSDQEMLACLFSPCSKPIVLQNQISRLELRKNQHPTPWTGTFDSLSNLYQKQKYSPKRIDSIEQRIKYLKQPRSVGSWSAHLAHFVQLSLHTRRQAPNTKCWLRGLPNQLWIFSKHSYSAGKVGKSAAIKLTVSPRNPRYHEKKLCWQIDARHIPAAEGFSLFVEKLCGVKNLRDIPHNQPHLLDTVSPKTGFPTPGKYRVWAVATGRFGKHLGRPSQKVELQILA